MTAQYKGLEFKTRLEARWAAFFDMAGWSWWTNPVAVGDWKPDFKVEFPCRHSECDGSHTLFVTVLPVENLDCFLGLPCLTHSYGVKSDDDKWLADAGAAFGASPTVTRWEMSHGSGGGEETVMTWVDNYEALWRKAAQQIS